MGNTLAEHMLFVCDRCSQKCHGFLLHSITVHSKGVCLLAPLGDLKAPLSHYLFKSVRTHTHTHTYNPICTSVWFREGLGLVWPQVRVSALTSTVMATDVQDIPRTRKQEFQLCGNLCSNLVLNCPPLFIF